MGTFIDLTGKVFGDWTVVRYIGKSMWECIDSKGNIKNIHSYTLRTKLSNFTKVGNNMPEGILDKTFGQWKPIKYLGGGFWECRCSCGNIGKVNTYDLKNNLSTKCRECAVKGMRKGDLKPNDVINEWTLMYYAGNLRWHCKCSCGVEKDVLARDLVNKSSKSCGHDRNYHIIRKDITGEHFGSLVVLGYTGKDNMWRCRCENCNSVKDIHRNSLVTGKTKSCGCLKEKMRAQTLYDKYGDTNTTRINNPREDWQIQIILNRESFIKYLNSLGHKPTVMELRELLDIREGSVKNIIKKFDIKSMVQYGEYKGESTIEKEVQNFLDSLNIFYIKHDREMLFGQELDIYIPDKKIAIEINGTYWHSSIFKNEKYHQNKTLTCAKNGIHLIHIFEYEWRDILLKNKIKYYIKSLLIKSKYIDYAKNISIEYINSEKLKKFLNDYWLYNTVESDINIGCIWDNMIIGVISFRRLEYIDNYELVNLCWHPDFDIMEGLELTFSKFIKNYKPNSIISYINISKFTGNSYTKIGFKISKPFITEPNYVWVDMHNNQVLGGYQAMRHNQLENLGDIEDEIMQSLGYIKVYDSGRLKLEWLKN